LTPGSAPLKKREKVPGEKLSALVPPFRFVFDDYLRRVLKKSRLLVK
jgi:hypothetical protein